MYNFIAAGQLRFCRSNLGDGDPFLEETAKVENTNTLSLSRSIYLSFTHSRSPSITFPFLVHSDMYTHVHVYIYLHNLYTLDMYIIR